MLQAEIETQLTLRQSDILPRAMATLQFWAPLFETTASKLVSRCDLLLTECPMRVALCCNKLSL